MAPNKPVPPKLVDYVLSYVQHINPNKFRGSVKDIKERILLLPLLKSGMLYIESRLDGSAALDLSCPIPFNCLHEYLQAINNEADDKIDLTGLRRICTSWRNDEAFHSICKQVWIEFPDDRDESSTNKPRVFLHDLNVNPDISKQSLDLYALESLISLAILDRSSLKEFDARCCVDVFIKMVKSTKLMQLSTIVKQVNGVQKQCLRAVLQIQSNKIIEQLAVLGIKLVEKEIAFTNLIEKSQRIVGLSLDILAESGRSTVINVGIECYTANRATEIQSLFELINSYSKQFLFCRIDRGCLDYIFEVKRILWPRCSLPILTYRNISHVKFSLVTNEARSAKLYSCIEVVRNSTKK